VEAKAWQAFYATLLLERSKFGLNELLGAMLMSPSFLALSRMAIHSGQLLAFRPDTRER
jgi:hypothetical protein